MIKTVFTAVQLAALTIALAGCSGLASLTEVTKPVDNYVLTPKSTFDSGLPKLKFQIVVEQPTATASVDTDRIAVQPDALQVQYLADARWVDRAPLIVQALLIESFENSDRVPAVGSSTIGLRADFLIVTDIREFQAFVPDGDPNAPLHVDVRLNIKIVDAFEDRIIASRSFEEVVPAVSDAPRDVVEAFDEALGDTMRDSVEWSIRQIARYAG
ncbi:ABC-type transport auxiliary lipoprotein family protein [uncultured Tateyamaria sp.]|uniref:ABC-type transport auxiliary lipoprotein family protein n=1 Tax=uncultured Tateyamaria sp. TaxID=455651 RepID=UPI00261A3F4F|nr:ABC-type transport auxiliary lipoprotein family protein [uncultured Tateyamaria sp.]